MKKQDLQNSGSTHLRTVTPSVTKSAAPSNARPETHSVANSGKQSALPPHDVGSMDAHELLQSAVRESLRDSLTGSSDFFALNHQDSRSEITYNELSFYPVQKRTPIEVLKSNLDILEGLVGRWSFVMRENRYILKLDNTESASE